MPEFKVILTVIRGPQQGLTFELTRDSIYIGREKEMDLILSDPAVSGTHARIMITPMGIEIEDLGSRNGTFVNDVPVQSSMLKSMDRILIGQNEIQVKLVDAVKERPVSSPPPAPSKTPPASPHIKEETKESSILVPVISRILVAGFPENLRKVIVSQIAGQNLAQEVKEVSNGGEALELLAKSFKEESLPELIITSLKMPILNGVNMSVAFRAYEQGFARRWKVPIIFLTPSMESDGGFKKAVSFLAPARHIQASNDPHKFAQKLHQLFEDLRERAKKGVPLV